MKMYMFINGTHLYIKGFETMIDARQWAIDFLDENQYLWLGEVTAVMNQSGKNILHEHITKWEKL